MQHTRHATYTHTAHATQRRACLRHAGQHPDPLFLPLQELSPALLRAVSSRAQASSTVAGGSSSSGSGSDGAAGVFPTVWQARTHQRPLHQTCMDHGVAHTDPPRATPLRGAVPPSAAKTKVDRRQDALEYTARGVLRQRYATAG
jgi:hypothetical protein